MATFNDLADVIVGNRNASIRRDKERRKLERQRKLDKRADLVFKQKQKDRERKFKQEKADAEKELRKQKRNNERHRAKITRLNQQLTLAKEAANRAKALQPGKLRAQKFDANRDVESTIKANRGIRTEERRTIQDRGNVLDKLNAIAAGRFGNQGTNLNLGSGNEFAQFLNPGGSNKQTDEQLLQELVSVVAGSQFPADQIVQQRLGQLVPKDFGFSQLSPEEQLLVRPPVQVPEANSNPEQGFLESILQSITENTQKLNDFSFSDPSVEEPFQTTDPAASVEALKRKQRLEEILGGR